MLNDFKTNSLLMKNKIYKYSGITAFVIYIIAVTIGGMLYPGYSHISMDVSQLTSTNSPIKDFMNIFFIYNILVSIFGFGLYKKSVNKTSKIASIFVIAIGILGLLISFFPINTRGTDITLTGIIHIIIVSMVSLLTVSNGILYFFGFRKTKHSLFAKISLTAGILFLIFGPIAGININSPYAGLFERIPIGIFLTWMLVSSIIMF